MTALRIIAAQPDDLRRYIDLLEEVADWLTGHGIKQWRPGTFRLSVDYYAESIRLGEVQLAFCGEALVGTLRLLLREPIVWPEVVEDDDSQEPVEGSDEAELVVPAAEPIADFVDSLTNWYIRRSRRRFWKSDSDEDKNEAYGTLYYCLVRLSQLIAPFTPFIAEEIYRNLTNAESVHLSDWPDFDESKIDKDLNAEMGLVRKIVALGHGVRAKKMVKVRQPLLKVQVALPEGIAEGMLIAQREVILEELNVKDLELIKEASTIVDCHVTANARVLGPKYGGEVQNIIREVKEGRFEIVGDKVKVLGFELSGEEVEIGFKGKEGYDVASENGLVVALDTNVTDELKIEGHARDIVRFIQDLRKEADFEVDNRIVVEVKSSSDEISKAVVAFEDYIKRETLADEINPENVVGWDKVLETSIEGDTVQISVKKV